MITERRIFWLILATLFGLLCFSVSNIIEPFVFCAALAYMLDPLVDWLEKHHIPRGLGATIVCFGFFLIFALLLLLVIPLLVNQVVSLARALPDLLSAFQEYLAAFFSEPAPWFDQLLGYIGVENTEGLKEEMTQKVRDQISTFGAGLFSDTSAVLRAVASRISSLGDGVSTVLLVPIILFYLLRDWDNMTRQLLGIAPRSKVRIIQTLGLRCNRALGGFFRGQLSVMILLGLIYAIGLSLVGLPYGFTIGIFAGLLSFIPYVGAISGFAASIIVALVHFSEWLPIIMVGVVFLGGQTLESMVLTPKLIGDSIDLHPVWIIFGLLAGGSLLGFIGLLLAIPLMAVIAVFVRFSIEQYQSSVFFEDNS